MALNGNLKDFRLEDIFQFLGLGQYMGCLRITRRNGIIGEIFFDKSKVIYAKTGSVIGEQAIYEMFDWNEGAFIFDLNLSPPGHTIDGNWQNIILEAARLNDEEHRDDRGRDSKKESSYHETGDFDLSFLQEKETIPENNNADHDHLIDATFKEKESVFDLQEQKEPSVMPEDEIPVSGIFGSLAEKKEKKSPSPENEMSHPSLGKIGKAGNDEDKGIEDRIRGFNLDPDNKTSQTEPRNDGAFMAFALNTLVKEAETTFNISREEAFGDISAVVEETATGRIVDYRSSTGFAVKTEAGADEIRDLCMFLTRLINSLYAAASPKSLILFLKDYYVGLSGKERLMEKRFGYPLLSIKNVVDSAVDQLRRDNQSILSD